MVTHAGGCHCGRVRFEVRAPAKLEVADCNCSICAKVGYLHLIVPADRFTLISGREALHNVHVQHARRQASFLLPLRSQVLLHSALAS